MRARLCGLTLTELLVVIVIIVLIVALLFPVVHSARYRAKDGVCISNMRQILVAIQLYRNDYVGGYPRNFKRLLTYVQTREIFNCPLERDDRYVSVLRVLEGIPNLSYLYAGTNTVDFDVFVQQAARLDPNHGIIACVWHPKSNLQHPMPYFAPHVRRGLVDGSVHTVIKRAPTSDELNPRDPTQGCISSWLIYTNAPCPREYCHHPECGAGD